MRAPRAPPSSSSLLHLVCRHNHGFAKSIISSSTFRPQCARSHLQVVGGSNCQWHPLQCSHSLPRSIRAFTSASQNYSGLQRNPPETDRPLSFLSPKEIFSRRGSGISLTNWKRGLFGRKIREEPSEQTTSSTYLDSGSENSILGRHLLHKPNDMVLRCTEFDQDGK